MAYTPGTLNNVTPFTVEGSPKLWQYTTADAQGTVTASSYITDVTNVTSGGLATGNKRGMAIGDFILVSAPSAGTPYTALGWITAIGSSGATVTFIAHT
jgi:hypothetical protein